MPTLGESTLLRRVKWIATRFVVGDIDHGHDLAEARSQEPLDALPDCHLGQAATLTAAFEPELDAPIEDADQRDVAPVGSDSRVHLVLEHPADTLREVAGCGARRRFAILPHYADPGHLRHGGADKRLDRFSRRQGRPGR